MSKVIINGKPYQCVDLGLSIMSRAHTGWHDVYVEELNTLDDFSKAPTFSRLENREICDGKFYAVYVGSVLTTDLK